MALLARMLERMALRCLIVDDSSRFLRAARVLLEGEGIAVVGVAATAAEALTRAGLADRSRLDQARLMFERMLGYANHVGLFAEETSMSGDALGNFPQAFTHFALISAAFNLDRALGARD